jgi:hypothetical protein
VRADACPPGRRDLRGHRLHARLRQSSGIIFIVPARGGDPERLAVERLRVVRFPTWAPSADIAFDSDSDLWAVAPDGSNLRRLTEATAEELTPAWGPDGSLAFQLSFWVSSGE